MIDRADENPEAWADRRLGGDGATVLGTNGARSGTSGVRMTAAWALTAAVMGLAAFVNVMTSLDDARRGGVRLPLALPLTLELTSAVATLCSVFIIVIALRLAPPGRGPWWRWAAIHLGSSLAFSAVHVTLMTLLRAAIATLAHYPYSFSLSELPYEYRKDLLTYVMIGVLFWLLTRQGPAAVATLASGTPAAPATFDIRDGASILRVAVAEIIAVTAAGNYVEFVLEDGRRPLMRASMAAVAAALAPHGFLRTHRSWLVNAGRVRALTAAGSGDFRLDLGCGLTAPLSRRYPAALTQLKTSGDDAPSPLAGEGVGRSPTDEGSRHRSGLARSHANRRGSSTPHPTASRPPSPARGEGH